MSARLFPATVVDVGAGAGTAVEYYKPFWPDSRWTAIEVWEPYVGYHGLVTKYDTVIRADVRQLAELPEADLYLCCDVLEHMTLSEAVILWGRILQACKVAVISLPVRLYPQGAEFGNPYEEHVTQYDIALVRSSFYGIVAEHDALPPPNTVGAFIAYGARI